MKTAANGVIGVVGLGRSGAEAVRFLARLGQPVLAWDEKPLGAGVRDLADLPGVTLHQGPLERTALAGCREILLSPGIPRRHPALAGLNPINDVEFLHWHVRDCGQGALFAGITGANGKSTVTSLLGAMACAAGRARGLGGNLGPPALSLWDPTLEGYILELSSFQLESIREFRPRVGVFLNLTPDHMDRYPDLDGYRRAKERIFMNQGPGDVAVVNADDPETQRWPVPAGVRVMPFSLGADCPGGVHFRDGHLVESLAGRSVPLLAEDDILLVGRHNRANAAAATAAALALDFPREAIVRTLTTFGGLEHRMQLVGTVDGIRFFNDSKGTNVGAVVASLAGFDRDVVLIAGGRDKKGDFGPLAEAVQGRVVAAVLIGEAADDLERALGPVTRVVRAASMQEAVHAARGLASAGGTVLLSPACASFDMFANFEDRGRQFRDVVHGLQ